MLLIVVQEYIKRIPHLNYVSGGVVHVTYLISAVIDGWFISKGKTLYNAINSVIVNIGYYGVVYVLFKHGVFEMNMNFIVMMFGFGMVVHMVGSIVMYRWELKKTNISIAN